MPEGTKRKLKESHSRIEKKSSDKHVKKEKIHRSGSNIDTSKKKRSNSSATKGTLKRSHIRRVNIFSTKVSNLIFSYLSGKDLASVGLVCFQWYEVSCNNDSLWEKLFKNEYTKKYKGMNYRECYSTKMNWNCLKFSSSLYQVHSSAVNAISCFEDRVVTASSDDKIRLWNIKTMRHKTLKDHNDKVTSVQFLSKNCVISGSEDTTVKIWDSSTCKQTLYGRAGTVYCLDTVQKDNVVVVGYDKCIKVWDYEKAKVSTVIEDDGGPIFSLKVDGELVVTGSRDKCLKVWDLRQKENVLTVVGHEGSITCMDTKDSNTLFTGSADETIMEWDLRYLLDGEEAKPVKIIRDHNGPVRTLKIDNTRLISGSFDKTVKFFDIESGMQLKSFEHFDSKERETRGSVKCVSFDHRSLYIGWNDGTLQVCDYGRIQRDSTDVQIQ